MIAFFLDRDGVITRDPAFKKVDQLEVLPGAISAIKKLNRFGLVIIITNQPAVARNILTEDDLMKLHAKLTKEIRDNGAKIDAIYYCPHHPEKNHPDIAPIAMKYRIECQCRKPKTGLLEQAAKDFNLTLEKCFVVGDSASDIKAGNDVGCQTILLKTGNSSADKKYDTTPNFVANDLCEAADLIEMNLETKALILAGGRGERLKPLTDKLPKPMLPIAGKPIIQHQIELLKKYGINKIIIAGHYLFNVIKDYFGSGEKFGVKIEYCDEEIPLGTGGAIKNAENLLSDTENFIVFSGDILTEINVKPILQFHKNKNALATLVLRHSDHPLDSDVVEIDANSRFKNFIGRGQNKIDTSIASLFVFNRKIFDFIPKNFCILEKDVISQIYRTENIYGYLTDEYAKDIGTIERYKSAKKLFFRK